MRLLHVFNRHRGGGGSDNATDATIGLLREKGVDIRVLSYDGGDLPPGLRGKWRAFASGVYAREPIRRIASLIEEFRPDVVHVYELYPLISPWILAECRRRGVPVGAELFPASRTNAKPFCAGLGHRLRIGCR